MEIIKIDFTGYETGTIESYFAIGENCTEIIPIGDDLDEDSYFDIYRYEHKIASIPQGVCKIYH